MDKKLILFLVSFFAFYLLYNKFVLERIAPPPRPKPPATSKPLSPSAVSPVPAEMVPSAPSDPSSAETQRRKAIVETDLYWAEFRNQGAVLTSFRLKQYKDEWGRPLEMIPQGAFVPELPVQLELEDPSLTRVAQEAIYWMNTDHLKLRGKEKGALVFSYSNGKIAFRKYLEFHADSYILNAVMEAKQGDSFVPLRVAWTPGIETSRAYKKVSGLRPSQGIVNTGDEVKRWNPKDTKSFTKIGSTVRWVGVENNYFIGVFIPVGQPADAYMNQAHESKNKWAHNVDVSLASTLNQPLQMRIFIGPKDYGLLKHTIGMDLDQAVNFGFFGPIAKGLFLSLHFFYRYTGNYGWAIVLLTILIKILFTPLTQKSFASMKKMQAMQPELKKIQDKYARMRNDDPRKQNMNVEIMQLHKRYGVNPLGGCLPMLLQMPVLIAFYNVLSNSVELRQAPFGLWLQDLAAPDPYWVTPLLMGGTMMLQQKMTPPSDPAQQRMMYIMPIMFTYISLNLQSGLVLYWLLSNVLGILHQYYFQRQSKKVAVLREKNA